MEINSLPKSNITVPKPEINVDPKLNAPAPKAKVEEKKPVVVKEVPKVADVKPSTAKDVAITEVKPTGEVTTEGEPTFTLKVNGKDVKATQSEIIALAQKAQGAEAAIKAKTELEKLTSQFLETLDSDTYGVLERRLGKEKAKEIAINMVKNLIADEAKDPKDVEIERLKKFETDSKTIEDNRKKQETEAKRLVDQKVLYTKILNEIDQELNNTVLPKDKLTLTRVLNFLAAGKKANGETWTVKDAVQAVEQEDMSHSSYYAKQYVEGKLPSEKFRAIFGEETFKKLNKEQIDTLKKADKVVKAEAKTEAIVENKPKRPSLSRKTNEGVSEREWRRDHGSMGGI